MEMPTINRNFAKQISLDEYNKQKKEYTEKALQELKSQMADFKPSTNVFDNTQDNSEDYSSDYSSSEKSADVNVIIKTYKDSAKSENNDTKSCIGVRKRRVVSKSSDNGNGNINELSNAIYAQRELDLKELQRQRNKIKQLKSALVEEERKNHFLKLELCNTQVDNSDLKQIVKVRDTKIIQLENLQNKTWWQIMKLKMLLGFLVILYIYTFLF